MSIQPFVENNKILECVVGSHAYGMATEDSDLDIRGITIAPLEYCFGLKNFEQQQYPKPEDKVIYDLKKFMMLAAGCNPNIIEILFIPEKHVRFVSAFGKLLMNHRNLFLSKKAKFTFSGYAVSQLKRIKRHYRWLSNPPSQPIPDSFLKNRYMVLLEKDGSMMPTKASFERWESFFGPKWVEQDTPGYDEAKKEWDQYCQWRKERNPDRAELEKKYGFDAKHATHLVRLFRMGEEILKEGKVIVDRREAGDADELLAIRNGSMTYDELLVYAEDQDKKLDALYESSILRRAPDMDAINALYMDMVMEFHGIRCNEKGS